MNIKLVTPILALQEGIGLFNFAVNNNDCSNEKVKKIYAKLDLLSQDLESLKEDVYGKLHN